MEKEIKIVTNEFGTVRYYLNGKKHREDGPAMESSDGTKRWFNNWRLHREDGPAVEYANGSKEWFINGEELSEEEFNNLYPQYEVVTNEYGTIRYYLNGELHREDGPAVEYANGDKFWIINGELHREDGPAIEYASGSKEWFINGNELTEQEFNRLYPQYEIVTNEYGTIRYYLNGELHREDGPAVEYTNGDKFWIINGKKHREDGPAIEFASGNKYWFINGEELTEQEFNKLYPQHNNLDDMKQQWFENGVKSDLAKEYWFNEFKSKIMGL